MIASVVRGRLLVPMANGRVDYFPDGAIAGDAAGMLQFAGDWKVLSRDLPKDVPIRVTDAVILPPLIDIHTHIPQHPIRGKFIDGVAMNAPEGRLLAGLKKNVFPAEARCGDRECATDVSNAFLADTLSHGVVGGASYMTVSTTATETALSILPDTWSVGLVMMNFNCPADLRTDEPAYEADMKKLVDRFGKRVIVTDRFAISVDTPLRKRGVAIAEKYGLRTQTHLNEQITEKDFIERSLYPGYGSYTNVYKQDGLLDHSCIAAHCIHMTKDEWKTLRDTGTTIAHCPTSNLLLGSGVMSLDSVFEFGIPYAIATDVGASPTVSMLAEMARFLQVHAGSSDRATASEALYRSTRAPAELLEIAGQVGTFEIGRPMSFIEVKSSGEAVTSDEVIRSLLPTNLDSPSDSVQRVTLDGKTVFERKAVHA